MSIKSMIRKAGTTCTFTTLTEVVGDGGKLTKTWAPLYSNVPCRVTALLQKKEIMYYDAPNVFADYVFYILYKTGISEKLRIVFKARTFYIEKVDDFDEMKTFLRISAKEAR